MKDKKMVIALFYIFLGFIVCETPERKVLASNISKDQIVVLTSNKIEVRKDKIEWRYKVINGKLYKRQYNLTRQKWIGKWAPI